MPNVRSSWRLTPAIIMTLLAETTFTIPIGWALTGFISLCGIVAGMGKLIFSMCMWRIKALEKDVARLSRGCGVPNCHWRTAAAPCPAASEHNESLA